jgi:adenylate cyclase
MSDPLNIQPLFDWLVDGAPGAADAAAVVLRLGSELVERGVRIARLAAFVRTLHPNIMGRSFVWRRGAASAQVNASAYDVLTTDEYKQSPAHSVFRSGCELRRRLGGDAPDEYEILSSLRREGMTDYLVLPMRFLNGEVHAITFATDAADGFTEEELAALRTVTRALTRLAEVLALRRTATALLNAYVGRDAGERVLRGQIQRGDVECLRCVIWFSDLRGFTTLSGPRRPVEIIQILNQVFDCQVPAVERHGGEVLKFIGDGMLAIFSVHDESARAAVCGQALAATTEAFAALDALNRDRDQRGEPPLAVGVSLHLGEVAYGNIGGAARLDFTCIGAAVNLAARIEGLTGALSKRLLLSEEFARATEHPVREVGAFNLKGVAGAMRVFEPTSTTDAGPAAGEPAAPR